MRVGEWVALVCFVSLAALGWWVLWWGWSWWVAGVGAFWILVGTLAIVNPEEWERRRK